MYDNTGLVRQVVALLAHGRAGLITDIDGTISPIVARPEHAMVLPKARAALIGLRDRLALVGVVTGRAVDEARALVDVDGLTYVGNHGLELFAHGRAVTVPEAQPWVPRLATVLAQVADLIDPALRPAVVIENKGSTASLHYRLASDPDQVRLELLAILARTAAPSGLRLEEGRRVINLMPPLSVSKESAVAWMAREHALDAVVYLGDDLTDAHAFHALEVLRQSGARTLSIAVVGAETPSALREMADASVPTVAAVADLLGAVLDGLTASDRMGSRAPSVGSN